MLSLFNIAHAAILTMIATFRHKGLRRFFETGTTAGIQPSHARRLQLLLLALDAAHAPADLDKPGFRFHCLSNTQPQRWSLHVNANWRLTFVFDGGAAYAVDYEDYH
jgi:proteic killer suppression protein